MSKRLKWLIAASFFVLITGVGYFSATQFMGWSQPSDMQAKHDEDREIRQSELFFLADAEDGDSNKVKTFCRSVQDKPSIVTPTDASRRVLSTCLTLGFL